MILHQKQRKKRYIWILDRRVKAGFKPRPTHHRSSWLVDHHRSQKDWIDVWNDCPVFPASLLTHDTVSIKNLPASLLDIKDQLSVYNDFGLTYTMNGSHFISQNNMFHCVDREIDFSFRTTYLMIVGSLLFHGNSFLFEPILLGEKIIKLFPDLQGMNTTKPGTGINMGDMITIFEQHFDDLSVISRKPCPPDPWVSHRRLFWLHHKGGISIHLKFGLGVPFPVGLLTLKFGKAWRTEEEETW